MPIRVFLADFSSSPMNQPFRLLIDGNSARNIGSLFLSAGSDGRSRISGSLNLPSPLRVRSYMLILSHYATSIREQAINLLIFLYHLSLW